MKICRFCRQEVDLRARRCAYCQADLSLWGRFRVVQSIITAVIAIGGVAFGFYEKHIANNAEQELQQEQKALTEVLESVPENAVAEKYKAGQNEDQLKAELKKNPRNLQTRIQLRWLQRRRGNNDKSPGVKRKSLQGNALRRPSRGRGRGRRSKGTQATFGRSDGSPVIPASASRGHAKNGR